MTNVKLNKWSEKFRQSLAKPLRSWSEEQREAMAVTIETELPEWLREAFGVEVESVFDLTSASMLRGYRDKIASNPVASGLNADVNGRFDHALKLYIDFLDSKFNPLKKKLKSYGAPPSQGVKQQLEPEEESNEISIQNEPSQIVAEPDAHYLNKNDKIEQWIHNLPHWEQEGRIQFVTFRLADSLPQVKLRELKDELTKFETNHPQPWDEKAKNEFLKLKNKKIEYWLEQGYGECVLRRPEVRSLLTNAIDYVNGVKCLILGYVIMPNHVHMLLLPLPGYKTSQVLGCIRQYASTQINKLLNRKGGLWQDDPFDRTIRGETHLKYCIRYIQNNPKSLSPHDYTLFFDYRLINAVLNGMDLFADVPPLGSGGSIGFTEGAIVQQTVDRRERNPQARQACIEKYGCKCMVCGFDFESIYGDVGRGYIEVHHLKPISQTDDEHEVSVDDLVPLCANCHAMAHRRHPMPFTVEELKGFMGLGV